YDECVLYRLVQQLIFLVFHLLLSFYTPSFTFELITEYPKFSIAFSIVFKLTCTSSKSTFTLLALNSTFTESFTTPAVCFKPLSIFCKHDVQVNVSNFNVALVISITPLNKLYKVFFLK